MWCGRDCLGGEMSDQPNPLCPDCGGPVVAALMTSGAIESDGSLPHYPYRDRTLYYAPSALSVYCCSASCNYDAPLASIGFPPPRQMRAPVERLTADLAAAKAEISRLRGILADTAAGKSQTFTPGYRAEPGPRMCRVCGRAMQAVVDGDRHGWCG